MIKKAALTLAVFGLMAASAVLAPAQAVFPTDEQAPGNGGPREIALSYRTDGPSPVAMPAPRDPFQGPNAFADGDAATLGRGAAIPNTGGGQFSTSRKQADRNIRQLIRKLG